MASVKDHYDGFLAPYYAWISGDTAQKHKDNRRFFETHGIAPALSGIAVDLGAGSGFQSIPLAQIGFKVTAIDLSSALLKELKSNAQGLSIVVIEADLANFTQLTPPEVELIVCMGDTLTHLPSTTAVQTLIRDAFQTLSPKGHLIFSFRDMTPELERLDRFIPVRSDADRIFTCFLEYEKHHVRVHDIVYERIRNHWMLRKSYYRKLRLAPKWVEDCLSKVGLRLKLLETKDGIVSIIARKP